MNNRLFKGESLEYSIIEKTLDEYIYSITIVIFKHGRKEFHFTPIQQLQLRNLHTHGNQPLPLDFIQLLLNKELPYPILNELHDIVYSGGDINWIWLREIFDFHKNNK